MNKRAIMVSLTSLCFVIGFCISLALSQSSYAYYNLGSFWQQNGVSIDSTVAGGSSTGSNLSWSHTCNGTNRLLLVGVTIGNYGAATGVTSSVTYNGVSMASASIAYTNTIFGYAQLFYLVNPPTGTHTVQVNFSSLPKAAEAGSISLTGVNQTTPLRDISLTSASTGNPAISVKSAAGDLVVDLLASGISATSGKSLRWSTYNQQYTEADQGAQSTAAGASTTNMSYTLSQNNYYWGLIGVEVSRAQNVTTLATPTQAAVISSSQDIGYAQCSAGVLIQTQTSAGVPASMTTSSTITLSGSGATFYSDPNCANAVTSVTLPANTSTIAVYFESSASTTISAAVSGIGTAATQSETIYGTIGSSWYMVQATGMPNSGASVASQTLYLFQATHAGSFLVVACKGFGASSFTVTDNASSGSNTYTATPEGFHSNREMFYVTNSKAGATALTVTSVGGNSTYLDCALMEFLNGAGISGGLESGTGSTGGDNYVTGTTTAVNQTKSITIQSTAKNGDLLVLWGDSDNSQDTVSSPLNENYSLPTLGYEVQSSSGSATLSAVVSSNAVGYYFQALAIQHP